MQSKLSGLFFLAGRSEWWALCLHISCKFTLLSNIIHGNLSSVRQNSIYSTVFLSFSVLFCFFYPGFSSFCLLSLTSAYNTSVGGGRWGNFNSVHVAKRKKGQKQQMMATMAAAAPWRNGSALFPSTGYQRNHPLHHQATWYLHICLVSLHVWTNTRSVHVHFLFVCLFSFVHAGAKRWTMP